MIGTVCALILSYVFAAAALHKWRDVAAFRDVLANYNILRAAWVGPVSGLVPAVELLVAVLLLAPALAGYGAALAFVLLCAYGGGIAVNLARGRRSIDCGCGGTGSQMLSEWLLLRNGVLLILAVISGVAGAGTLAWYEWAVVLPAVVAGCLIYNIGNQLLVNKDMLANLRIRNG